MMGHTHALSGMAAGALLLPVAPASGVHQVAWVIAWGGFAMLPDLDQRASTVSRMWGPVTAGMATVLGAVAGGHRKGTHDLVLAPLFFGLAAAVLARFPVPALIMFAFSIGLALRACAFVLPSQTGTVAANLVLSFAGAWFLVGSGQSIDWLVWAVAGGVAVHILGDALTHGGVPFPVVWLPAAARGKTLRVNLPLTMTGSPFEAVVLATVFAGISVLAIGAHLDVDMGSWLS